MRNSWNIGWFWNSINSEILLHYGQQGIFAAAAVLWEIIRLNDPEHPHTHTIQNGKLLLFRNQREERGLFKDEQREADISISNFL